MRSIEIQRLIENFNEDKGAENDNFDSNTVGQKTLMLRTKLGITTNFNLLLSLYIFGLKTVHPRSEDILKELDNRNRLSLRSKPVVDRAKLYGLYRTDNYRTLFDGSTKEVFKYLQS